MASVRDQTWCKYFNVCNCLKNSARKSSALKMGTFIYVQATADRVEWDMREASKVVMAPLMHKLALLTATVNGEH